MSNFCKKGGNPFHHHQGLHEIESIVSSTASNIPSHHSHHYYQQREIRNLLNSSANFIDYHSRDLETLIVDANISSQRIAEPEPRGNDDEENLLEEIDEQIEKVEKSTDPSAHSHFRYIMLAVVLSVHSVFEGMALGLESHISTVIQLFAAIAIHKCVVAFSLGLNMVQSGLSNCLMNTSLCIFCLASPVGGIIG